MAQETKPPLSGEEQPVPDPRSHERLIGREAAQAEFLDVFGKNRLHHGWLLCGPRGAGKATLGFQIARFVLRHGGGHGGSARPATTLEIGADDPVFRQVAALSHPDFLLLHPGVDEKTGLPRRGLLVDEARKAGQFFAKSPALGAFRVCMIDAVDDMNRQAANAILKILEEPPPHSLFILIAHRPGLVLPTIRSRCRQLRLLPMSEAHIREVLLHHLPDLDSGAAQKCARLAAGAPGRALMLATSGGLDLHDRVEAILDAVPRIDSTACLELSQQLARRGSEETWNLFMEFVLDWLVREARRANRRLKMDSLLLLWEKVNRIRIDTPLLNLDRAAATLNVFLLLEEGSPTA